MSANDRKQTVVYNLVAIKIYMRESSLFGAPKWLYDEVTGLVQMLPL